MVLKNLTFPETATCIEMEETAGVLQEVTKLFTVSNDNPDFQTVERIKNAQQQMLHRIDLLETNAKDDIRGNI